MVYYEYIILLEVYHRHEVYGQVYKKTKAR